MARNARRITRERRTVGAMIALYCRDHHGRTDGLCPDCKPLLDYALKKLDKCPFREGKTACARCPVHCYKPGMRQKIKDVMRYSGRRMIRRHPVLALFHMIDRLRKTPVRS